MLDEADQMLDLGFLPPIRRIVSQMSAKRQSLFFSATMPPEIGKLADEMLRDPVEDRRLSRRPPPSTASRSAFCTSRATTSAPCWCELLADPQMSRTLVFTRTKRGADRVARHLEDAGIRVAAIHGNKSQSQRERALAAFRASKIRVLVATDIAARGIDVDRSRTSSTSSCPTCRRAICTASAARPAPAPAASPSRSATPRSATSCATSSA